MKIYEMQFPRVVGAIAALLAFLVTAHSGLAQGVVFTADIIIQNSNPELRFNQFIGNDPSIEAEGDRLEFKHRDDSQFMFSELSTGRISFGALTTPPDAPFHFRATDDGSDARVLVDNQNSPTATPRNMFHLRNFGPPRFLLEDVSNSAFFAFALNPAGNFMVTRSGVPGAEFVLNNDGTIDMGPGTTTSFRVTETGVLATNYGQLSDREAKTDVEELSNREILSKIKKVPVSSWRFKGAPDSSLHIGPMAQDFREAFGTGTSDRVINVGDLAGVALAGVKSLTEELEARNAEVRELRERIGRLEGLLMNQK